MRNSDVPPHSGRVASPARPKEKEKRDDETIDHRQPWSHHAAPPAGRLAGMLDGTSRPTNPNYELDGIRKKH